ncbi:hypothetical protein Pcinc_043669 [Petrolisthes cinctipes]|uniref:Uncharacterized protein n=1 Tax=Petrolisthes cinctipes TaxID=88211 RepID=A0AAE1EEX4_PETCI|nr:hypothetical protein Pcinc_043669 [Petrolisthes cinctipes]
MEGGERDAVNDTRVGSGYRSAAQDLALVLAQEMFGCVARVVVELLPHHLHHQQHQKDDEDNNATTNTNTATTTTTNTTGDPQRLFSPILAHFMPPLKAINSYISSKELTSIRIYTINQIHKKFIP